MTHIPSYKPRYFHFHDIWDFDGLSMKVYLITVDDSVHVPDEMLSNAHKYIKKTMPAVRKEEGADHEVGYVVLHLGQMGNWLLIHWWAHSDIAMRLLASADIGATEFKSEDHRRFHACVWEHVVIDHERDAWIRTMMGPGDKALYLQDRLPDGAY